MKKVLFAIVIAYFMVSINLLPTFAQNEEDSGTSIFEDTDETYTETPQLDNTDESSDDTSIEEEEETEDNSYDE